MKGFPDEKTFWDEITRDAPTPEDVSAREKYKKLFAAHRIFISMSAQGMTPETWQFLEDHEPFQSAIVHLIRHISLLYKRDPESALKMTRAMMRDTSRKTHDIRFPSHGK